MVPKLVDCRLAKKNSRRETAEAVISVVGVMRASPTYENTWKKTSNEAKVQIVPAANLTSSI
jgi:hypothetical protein